MKSSYVVSSSVSVPYADRLTAKKIIDVSSVSNVRIFAFHFIPQDGDSASNIHIVATFEIYSGNPSSGGTLVYKCSSHPMVYAGGNGQLVNIPFFKIQGNGILVRDVTDGIYVLGGPANRGLCFATMTYQVG